MNKTGIVVLAISTLLLLVGGAFLLTRKEAPMEISAKEDGSYEYFWGEGCTHCANVADFFNTSEKDDNLNIKKYEVWYEKKNQDIMKDRYDICQEKPQGQLSVPFLITPENICLMGDTPIIEYFESL